jgi:putative membrane protein
MMNIAETFLGAAGRRQVEERIEKAEKRTSGEIVVMIAPSSYHYPYAGLLGSTLLSILLSVAVSLVFAKDSMWFFLCTYALSFILMHELSRRLLFLKRPFISSKDMEAEVEEAAVMAFYRSGINRTAGHTGILLYISLFEHKVRVVADQGINAKVGQPVWQEVADIVSAGFRGKAHAEALSKAVDRCADILAEHFPPIGGKSNELPDTVIIGD